MLQDKYKFSIFPHSISIDHYISFDHLPKNFQNLGNFCQILLLQKLRLQNDTPALISWIDINSDNDWVIGVYLNYDL